MNGNLTRQTFPDGHTDSDTGLGLRLTKNDSTGGYAYLCDGISPASSILSDGCLSFTLGISRINAPGSRFYREHKKEGRALCLPFFVFALLCVRPSCVPL